MRLERELFRETFASAMGERDEYPDAISMNSTIITEKGPKGMKNAYKYDEARQKDNEKQELKQKRRANAKALAKMGVNKKDDSDSD